MLFFLVIRAVLTNFWSGIQREETYGKGYEFKVCENPWAWENQRSPALVNELLSNLYANGWHFLGAIDTSRREDGLNALYFQKSIEQNQEIGRFFSISLKGSDKFRLHMAPPELSEPIRSVLSTAWPDGIQREEFENNFVEFKLHGKF